jgi:hypothetical protein
VGVNADGLAAGPDGTFTTAGGSTTGPPPSGALGIPAVTKLVVSPAAFAAAPRGPSARLARRLGKRRHGTTVTFSLSQAAGVRFTVSRQLPGRRSHGRCVAPTRKNHHAARCRRLRAVGGSFTRSGAAGTNRFRFLGRMGNRALRPGTYVLLATPVTGGQAGRSRSTSFRIVR